MTCEPGSGGASWPSTKDNSKLVDIFTNIVCFAFVFGIMSLPVFFN